MILIAENFNSSIGAVAAALENEDSAFLKQQAQKLDQSEADYIDLNAGTFLTQEAEKLIFLLRQVRAVSTKPIVLDSPNPEVLRKVADLAAKEKLLASDNLARPKLLLNSITLETSRFESVLKTALRHEAGVIALLMQDRLPESIQERLQLADTMIEKLTKAGVAKDRIFLDPMVRPVSTDHEAGCQALQTITALRQAYPNVHLSVGLSNISFGLPARSRLNQAFLLQAMALGLDAAILNPLDPDLMSLYKAGVVLSGQDEWCMQYLEHHR